MSNWPNKMGSNYAAGWRGLEKIFTSQKNTCKKTKLKEFQFKLIHRIVVTKKELFRYGIKTDDECLYCGEHDSIDHSFVDCEFVKNFVKNVINDGHPIPNSKFSSLKWVAILPKVALR